MRGGVIDVVIITSFVLLILAKILGVPPEWGIPSSFAAAMANALHITQG